MIEIEMCGKSVLLVISLAVCCTVATNRSFTIDIDGETFLRDGEPFRYISGIIHYFRVPRASWQDRLHKLRMAGFNAVQTYVEWRSHEPYSGKYQFEGEFDLLHFISLAESEGLLVILRAGPYICAERDFGGLPFWLLQENPNMKPRTSDPSYLKFVDRWFDILLPKIRPLLYKNGGPIISVQVENEYGSSSICDHEYMAHLRDVFESYFEYDVILFTVDNPYQANIDCGTIDGVFATVDFGIGVDVTENFRLQKEHNGGGPAVNSEYYSGWYDHWGYPHAIVDTDDFTHTLEQILDVNGSVSVYVFHGGTNFDFGGGANTYGGYQSQLTSYDYNAHLSEAGDPTQKYYKTRELLEKYVELPPGPVPDPSPKYVYDPVSLQYLGTVFDLLPHLSTTSQKSQTPMSFESVGQAYGYILYETVVKELYSDPVILHIEDLRDRAYVFIDDEFVGTLWRGEDAKSIPLSVIPGQRLQILAEGLGRDNNVLAKDMKGILSDVTLGKNVLQEWMMYMIPLNETTPLLSVPVIHPSNVSIPRGPGFYKGKFICPNESDLPLDTFLHLDRWTMGFAFVNGYNLGRYWPVMGPQTTLYVPKSILKTYPEENTILLMENERSSCHTSDDGCYVKFTDNVILDAPTPYK